MRSLLHLLRATATAFHVLLRRDSAILQLAVLLARETAVDLVASQRPETEKEFRRAVAADSFAAHSSPEIYRSFLAGFSHSQACPVTADHLIVLDLSSSAAADPDVVVVGSVAVAVAVAVAVGSVVVLFAAALASGLGCSACSVRSFAAVTGKVKAALAVFYF